MVTGGIGWVVAVNLIIWTGLFLYLLRLGARLTAPAEEILSAYRERDALAGRDIEWANGRGRAAGIDDEGRLVVETGAGRIVLDAGEVHLTVR